jgi:hypothetical protein
MPTRSAAISTTAVGMNAHPTNPATLLGDKAFLEESSCSVFFS